MNIYLIGMPGSGKSTIGKKLAKELNREYIDLDEYIEKKALMFIPEIFEAYGEQFFRDLETNCLKELADCKNLIISCGGGIIVKSLNKQEMKGLVICFDTSIAVLEERTKNTEDVRPLLKTKSIAQLYTERKDKYIKFADKVVDSTFDPVDKIIDLVREYESTCN